MLSLRDDEERVKTRKKQITAHVDRVISRYLSDLYEVETVFAYDCKQFNEIIVVLPDLLNIKITINRLHPSDCCVQTGEYTATFKVNSKPDKRTGGIFWKFDTYQVNDELTPIRNNITSAACIEFREKNGIEPGTPVILTNDFKNERINISYGELMSEIPFPPGLAPIVEILQTYPYKDKNISKLYEKYYTFPIIEYQQLVFTFLMIRWFRNSVLSVFPKDIARLIAKEIWALRLVK